jgi:hypothetical protein
MIPYIAWSDIIYDIYLSDSRRSSSYHTGYPPPEILDYHLESISITSNAILKENEYSQ